jgi:hypothetical protein
VKKDVKENKKAKRESLEDANAKENDEPGSATGMSVSGLYYQ